MIGLQYWFDFCHISTWISYRCTYVPSLLNLPPTSHPSRLLQNPGLSSQSHTANSHWLTISRMVMYMKEMAVHSSVLAWRIPGTEEPGGLLSMVSHRVGHDWSDLAAAAAMYMFPCYCLYTSHTLSLFSPTLVHKFVPYVYVSTAALQTDSSVPFF